MRLLAAYGLGVVLISVPVNVLGRGSGVELSGRTVVAVVASAPSSGFASGFVLDRSGDVLRVGTDGSLEVTASLGRRSAPFGTSVSGRAVFGGTRCEGGGGCERRVAQLSVLDHGGRVAATLDVARSSGWPTRLNGLALVGTARTSLWVNGGGYLHRVAVSPATGAARVVDEVPWPGGEPCLVDGRLYDLEATGGIAGRQGSWIGADPGSPPFQLVLRRWSGARWEPVASGATTMPNGRNAYCADGGYEIRDATTTFARWTPTLPWHPPPPSSPGPVLPTPAPPASAVSVSSAGASATAIATGSNSASASGAGGESAPGTGSALAAAEASGLGAGSASASGAGGESAPGTGSALAAVEASGLGGESAGGADGGAGGGAGTGGAGERPTAVVADGRVGSAFRCSATYRAGANATRCGMGAAEASTASQLVTAGTAGPAGPPSGTPQAVDHYNMCSAACGPGVRAHTRDLVVWLAERNRPAALSLNEACYDDAVHLGGRLPSMTTGAAYSALDTAVGCPGAVKRFGNVVLVDEGLEARTAWWAPFRTQAGAGVGAGGVPCDHRTDECRGVVCVDAGPPGARSLAGRRAYCSAHLESPRRDAEVADAQTSEYGEMVAARFADQGSRVLAGDFNLERSDTDDVLRPAGFRAAAPGPTVGSRPDGADEIDRIYDDAPDTADATVTSHCDRQASDHCYLTTAPPPTPSPPPTPTPA